MKAKKRKSHVKDEPIPNPLLVDEREFTDVVRKMVTSEPITRKNVEKRRNPERDTRYLPVFPALGKTKKSVTK